MNGVVVDLTDCHQLVILKSDDPISVTVEADGTKKEFKPIDGHHCPVKRIPEVIYTAKVVSISSSRQNDYNCSF